MVARNFIEAGNLPPTMRHPRAIDPRDRCTRTIVLDGKTYRCARVVSSRTLGFHEGIHDANAVHGDGGEVRW